MPKAEEFKYLLLIDVGDYSFIDRGTWQHQLTKLHTPISLRPDKQPVVFTEQVWTLAPVGTFIRRERILTTAGNRTTAFVCL